MYVTSAFYMIMIAGYIKVISKLYFFILQIEVDAMAAPVKCVNSPDSFCCICGSLIIHSKRTNISIFVEHV